jgi:hypothetical protein
MKMSSSAVLAIVALAPTATLAQSLDLNGKFKCIQVCRMGLEGNPAYVTQNGSQLNLLNEAGEPSRAWPDWFAPETRIWADAWNMGAVYSPDGMRIQFDNGTIWERDLGLPPPAVPRRRK